MFHLIGASSKTDDEKQSETNHPVAYSGAQGIGATLTESVEFAYRGMQPFFFVT